MPSKQNYSFPKTTTTALTTSSATVTSTVSSSTSSASLLSSSSSSSTRPLVHGSSSSFTEFYQKSSPRFYNPQINANKERSSNLFTDTGNPNENYYCLSTESIEGGVSSESIGQNDLLFINIDVDNDSVGGSGSGNMFEDSLINVPYHSIPPDHHNIHDFQKNRMLVQQSTAEVVNSNRSYDEDDNMDATIAATTALVGLSNNFTGGDDFEPMNFEYDDDDINANNQHLSRSSYHTNCSRRVNCTSSMPSSESSSLSSESSSSLLPPPPSPPKNCFGLSNKIDQQLQQLQQQQYKSKMAIGGANGCQSSNFFFGSNNHDLPQQKRLNNRTLNTRKMLPLGNEPMSGAVATAEMTTIVPALPTAPHQAQSSRRNGDDIENKAAAAAADDDDDDYDFETGEDNDNENNVANKHNRHTNNTGSLFNGSSTYNRQPLGLVTISSTTTSSTTPMKNYANSAGLSGLLNIGNTCFMNSVLQCLSNTEPLVQYILQNEYLNDLRKTHSPMCGRLMETFADLIKKLWSEDGRDVVDTTPFKNQLQRFSSRFMGFSQQDAQEFLRYLLEGLHEDVKRIKIKPQNVPDIDDNLADDLKSEASWNRYLKFENSKIFDLFVGQLKSTLKCTKCGHRSVMFDPFWDLSLPVPSYDTVVLQQCFEAFTREETLDGDEKPACSKCQQRQKCTKSFSIQKFPKILVIHLKRFSANDKFRSKLENKVDFPTSDLNLSAFSALSGSNCTYDLYAVSNHLGTVMFGHYTAFCRNPRLNTWHKFDDSCVQKISNMNIVTNNAYVLFYELRTHH